MILWGLRPEMLSNPTRILLASLRIRNWYDRIQWFYCTIQSFHFVNNTEEAEATMEGARIGRIHVKSLTEAQLIDVLAILNVPFPELAGASVEWCSWWQR